MNNDKPRGHDWASLTSEYRGGGRSMPSREKETAKKTLKDSITPTTKEQLKEVERLYQNYKKKYKLIGA